MAGYQDLLVWQLSMDLTEAIYRLTGGFPAEERYGLASQMRRAAVSIPSNLAEGSRRRNQNEWRQFIHIAYGSVAELETQMLLAKRLFPGNDQHLDSLETSVRRVSKLLNGLRLSIGRPKTNDQ